MKNREEKLERLSQVVKLVRVLVEEAEDALEDLIYEESLKVAYKNGAGKWYRKGSPHREGGPAVERPEGTDK